MAGSGTGPSRTGDGSYKSRLEPRAGRKQLTAMQAIIFSFAFVAFVALAQGAATSPGSMKDKIAAVSKKCAADSKVSADGAKLAFSQEVPKSESERCYLECIYRGVGIVKDDKFNLEGSKKLSALRFTVPTERSIADKLIDTCNKEIAAQGEKCSLGKAVRECFVKHGKQVKFFPSA